MFGYNHNGPFQVTILLDWLASKLRDTH